MPRPKQLEEDGWMAPVHRANLIIHELMLGMPIDVGLIQNAIIGAIEMAEARAYNLGAQNMRDRAAQIAKDHDQDPVCTAIMALPLEV